MLIEDSKFGENILIYASEINSHTRKILEIAKPVRMKLILDIILFLAQSVQFTTAMNPFPITPSIASLVAIEMRTPSAVLSISANLYEDFCCNCFRLSGVESPIYWMLNEGVTLSSSLKDFNVSQKFFAGESEMS